MNPVPFIITVIAAGLGWLIGDVTGAVIGVVGWLTAAVIITLATR
jgi:hypothetical protein